MRMEERYRQRKEEGQREREGKRERERDRERERGERGREIERRAERMKAEGVIRSVRGIVVTAQWYGFYTVKRRTEWILLYF